MSSMTSFSLRDTRKSPRRKYTILTVCPRVVSLWHGRRLTGRWAKTPAVGSCLIQLHRVPRSGRPSLGRLTT